MPSNFQNSRTTRPWSKLVMKIPTHLIHAATLPCKTWGNSHDSVDNCSFLWAPVHAVKVKASHTRYWLPSAGSGADPGVQAVSPQVTVSHPPDGRLPLLSTRPAVTSPAAEHHRLLDGTKLYCLVTEAHRCEQLAQGCYVALPRVGFEPAIASPTLYPLRHRATTSAV